MHFCKLGFGGHKTELQLRFRTSKNSTVSCLSRTVPTPSSLNQCRAAEVRGRSMNSLGTSISYTFFKYKRVTISSPPDKSLFLRRDCSILQKSPNKITVKNGIEKIHTRDIKLLLHTSPEFGLFFQ